jgi:DNA-binding beta-propeller fold protein YncE
MVVVTSEAKGAVILVRVTNGQIVKTIPTTQRASHMLAASAGGKRIFTTNIVDGTVSVINPAADKIESVIRVAPMVEGIAASPDGRTLWVGSNQRKTVNVVDVEKGSVTDSLVGFGFPYRMAVTPDGNLAVLSDPMLGEIRIIDTQTRNELARITVPAIGVVAASEFPGSASPEGIAISVDGKYAYVSLQGRNQVGILDLTELKLTAYMDAGGWPDGIGYSPLQR